MKAKTSDQSPLDFSLCSEVLSYSLIVWFTIAATSSACLITFIASISARASLPSSQ
jgi:hypothetical protein